MLKLIGFGLLLSGIAVTAVLVRPVLLPANETPVPAVIPIQGDALNLQVPPVPRKQGPYPAMAIQGEGPKLRVALPPGLTPLPPPRFPGGPAQPGIALPMPVHAPDVSALAPMPLHQPDGAVDALILRVRQNWVNPLDPRPLPGLPLAVPQAPPGRH